MITKKELLKELINIIRRYANYMSWSEHRDIKYIKKLRDRQYELKQELKRFT